MATKFTAGQIHIRWAIRRDMPEILTIDVKCFEYFWCEEDWINVLRQRNNIPMVAEVGERIAGVMTYELCRTQLNVLRFAVHPDYQRRGVGAALVRKLVSKLSLQRRNRVLIEVPERNLAAQLFFRSQGFKAISTLVDHENCEDAYLMQYRYTADKEAALQEKEIAR